MPSGLTIAHEQEDSKGSLEGVPDASLPYSTDINLSLMLTALK
jgi:hypothetical protein